MTTKTERILHNLPSSFDTASRESVLYALVDAFGGELQNAENALAAVLRAHWVDHVDEVDDLVRLAALYDVAPRTDETLDEFRTRLKAVIQAFIQGSVTVQGLLRMTALTLGLDIEADEAAWWERDDDHLTTIDQRGGSAAFKLLGLADTVAYGQAAQPARLVGAVDLEAGVLLPAEARLTIQLDENPPLVVLLNEEEAPVQRTLNDIVTAINSRAALASTEDNRLILTGATPGRHGTLTLVDDPNDAAEQVLGMPPREYWGAAATAARVESLPHPQGLVDLSRVRYLRLRVDDDRLIEVDCAATDPARTPLAHIRDAINATLPIAEVDGNRLILQSEIAGEAGAIVLEACTQEATTLLFGDIPREQRGTDAQPARFISRQDLTTGLLIDKDVPTPKIKLQIDNASYLIPLDPERPGVLRAREVVEAINSEVNAPVAAYDGQFIHLTSPTTGPESFIDLENITPEDIRDEGPATDIIEHLFGIQKRRITGEYATRAVLEGVVDLSNGVNVLAENLLHITLDHATPVTVDLRAAVSDPTRMTLSQIVRAINSALGETVAEADAGRLILRSPSEGAGSSLAILPDEETLTRRFVTRAVITNEAATQVFGFVHRAAYSTPETAAQLVSTRDLSRGYDLRETRYLRLTIDGQPPVEIDCAGRRPRATHLPEIVEAINNHVTGTVAFAEDGRLILRSPSTGRHSEVAIMPTRSRDLLVWLFNEAPGCYTSTPATTAYFKSLVDLREVSDVSGSVRLTIDDLGPLDVDLSGVGGVHDIVDRLNTAFDAPVAYPADGTVVLTSQVAGDASRIVFDVPAEYAETTQQVFGLTTSHTYRGFDAAPAEITSVGFQTFDMEVTRFLVLAVNDDMAQVIDCAAGASDLENVTHAEIVAAINNALGLDVATQDGNRLVLRAQTSLTLSPYHGGDVAPFLFDSDAIVVKGTAARPATLTGDIELREPVDLHERHRLRLAFDDEKPFDIELHGAVMESVSPVEIIHAINAVVPGLAALDDRQRLQLVTPGGYTRMELLPLRHLELIEYPPEPVSVTHELKQHGEAWSIENKGAAAVYARVQMESLDGTIGPGLVNVAQGWSIRLLTSLIAGQHLYLWEEDGLRAGVYTPGGRLRPLNGHQVLVGPWGRQAHVPTEATWTLNDGLPETLQLNNPLAPNIVKLTALEPGRLTIDVAYVAQEALINTPLVDNEPDCCLLGRVVILNDAYQLVDSTGQRIVELQTTTDDFDFRPYEGQTVRVCGAAFTGVIPQLFVETIVCVFDVRLVYKPPTGNFITEHYQTVTIGDDSERPEALTRQLVTRSRLAHGESLAKATILMLTPGRTDWHFVSSLPPEYIEAKYDEMHFPGGHFTEYGVFNVSRFTHSPPENLSVIYAAEDSDLTSRMHFTATWPEYRLGALAVNLPVELSPRFGGHFNRARFGAAHPETYDAVVMEPPNDARYLVTLVNESSDLVTAAYVPELPPGWEAVLVPFRAGHVLQGGREDRAARLYIGEPGFTGFIELTASSAGDWGNAIKVSARPAGPAMYDVTIHFAGDHFENGRQITLGGDPPARVGLLEAKAAGVAVQVTRNRS